MIFIKNNKIKSKGNISKNKIRVNKNKKNKVDKFKKLEKELEDIKRLLEKHNIKT